MEFVAVLGSAAITGLFYYWEKDTNYRYLNQIKNAPHLSIDPNLQSIVSEAPDHTIPYAVIEGSVEAIDKILKSEHASGVFGVLQMLIYKEHKWSFWGNVTRVINTITRSVPFVIKANNTCVKVDHPFSATKLELPIIHDKPMPFLQCIATEKTLFEGTVLLGIGKLSTSTGALVLGPPTTADSPYILSYRGFSEIVRDFQPSMLSCLKSAAKYFFGFITIVLLARLLFKGGDRRQSRPRNW